MYENVERKKRKSFGEWYVALASNPVEVKKAEIPVEKINGSILLITGKEDDVDTTGLSKIAINRLKSSIAQMSMSTSFIQVPDIQ